MIGFNPLTGEILIKVDKALTVEQLGDLCQMMQMQLDEMNNETAKTDNKAEDVAA